jgi:calcineurin-like phosphoesterase family protein
MRWKCSWHNTALNRSTTQYLISQRFGAGFFSPAAGPGTLARIIRDATQSFWKHARKEVWMHPKNTDNSSMFDRYVEFLGTQYVRDDGTSAQPASTKFIKVLREVQAAHRPGFDIGACIAGTQPGFAGRVWFWSDLHFFHANVIGYCDRPFVDMETMNETMLRNCLDTVSANDILVFGGDIAMGKVEATNELLRAIPAYKLNVVGNHDMDRKKGALLGLAVDEIAPCLEFSAGGRDYFVSHYPVREAILMPGQVNIHGHIHNQVVHPAVGSGSRHVNMSVEFTGYRPVDLAALLALNPGSRQ